MKQVHTDPYSQVPLYIKLKFGNQELADATAFFYKHEDRLYLVSNWHNFSGRNPSTGEALSKYAGIPNIVSCYACLNGQYIERKWLDFALADDAQAFWYEHPEHHKNVDIGVLPVTLPNEFRAMIINKSNQTNN